MEKLNVKFEDKFVKVGFDGNQDGENSVEAKINLQEVYEEIAAKGEASVAAVINFKMNAGSLVVSVDTDRDGENVLELKIDAMEAFEEATQK